MAIRYFCSTCDTEIDEFCAAHPTAQIDIMVVQPGIDDGGYKFLCDRCGNTAIGDPIDMVADEYLVDDPWTATGNFCPACATDDDPHHIPGNWLLSWS